MSRILSLISLMACSQEVLVHCPFTSFIGYFSRRSPETSSRTAAPLAQCEPRLIGESQLGSWPIQTPFDTSAVTVQPTEQCVHTLLRMTASAVSGPAAAASALRTVVSGIVPRTARPPAPIPERRKKARRSRAVLLAARLARELRRA